MPDGPTDDVHGHLAVALESARAAGATPDQLARWHRLAVIVTRAGVDAADPWSGAGIVRALGGHLARANDEMAALMGWAGFPEWCEGCDPTTGETVALVDWHPTALDPAAAEVEAVEICRPRRRPHTDHGPPPARHRTVTTPSHGPPTTPGRFCRARPRWCSV